MTEENSNPKAEKQHAQRASLKREEATTAWRIAVNACRFPLALALIFSGFVKAIDPLGTQYKIGDYLEALHWE